MAKTCIVCSGGAGSGEHIFPACLGGLRVNNGIYCEKHNNDYGPFAGELSNQLAFFNAQFGIRNTRTKQVRPVTLIDPQSGAVFAYDGSQLTPSGPRVISQNGNTATIAVTNEAELQQFLKEQEAKGITYQIAGPGTPATYIPGQLHIRLTFGGPDGLRAIGYVAQTFFAHCFPELARSPSMQPFIDYTLRGTGENFVWWDFDAPADLTPNAFPLGHRIIVGADADAGVAYARVSLFSTLDFAMVFYDLPSSVASGSVVNDIDPLAIKMPDDLQQRRETFAVAPVARPSNPTASLSAAINGGTAEARHELLMQRAEDSRRRNDAEALLDALRSEQDAAGKDRVVRGFWAEQPQRTMRLLHFGLSTAKEHHWQNNPIGPQIVAILEEATGRDETASSGLTPDALFAVEVASAALVEAMCAAVREGVPDQKTIEMLIAGGEGTQIATKAILRAKGLPC
jgi:hypothetical protein